MADVISRAVPVVVRIGTRGRAWLRLIADRRREGKLPQFSRKKSSEWTDADVDLVGVTGEYAVSVATGEPFDAESHGCLGDGGVDMVVRGVKCGVKTNHRRGGFLMVEFAKDLDPIDALVLVSGECGSGPTCSCRIESGDVVNWQVVGWVPVGEFRARCRTADWGFGRRWYMRPTDLYDIRTLGRV